MDVVSCGFVLFFDSTEKENLVVHAETKHDGEQQYRDRRLGDALGSEGQQALKMALLKYENQRSKLARMLRLLRITAFNGSTTERDRKNNARYVTTET